MGDNQCAACGQWAGRGHRCPTPSITPAPDRGGSVPVRSGGTLTVDVNDRVARAQAALGSTSSQTTLPDYVNATRSADRVLSAMRAGLSRDDDAEVARLVAGPLSDARRFAETAESAYSDDLRVSADHLRYAREGARDLRLDDVDAEESVRSLIDRVPEPPRPHSPAAPAPAEQAPPFPAATPPALTWFSPEEADALRSQGITEQAITVLDAVNSGDCGWDQKRYFTPFDEPTNAATFKHAFGELVSGWKSELIEDRPQTLARIYHSPRATPAMRSEIKKHAKQMASDTRTGSGSAAARDFLRLIS